MGKIIRVSGCHDCLYPTKDDESEGLIIYCEYPCFFLNIPIKVVEYISNKTLPSNCPLENEDCELPSGEQLVDIVMNAGLKTGLIKKK